MRVEREEFFLFREGSVFKLGKVVREKISKLGLVGFRELYIIVDWFI